MLNDFNEILEGRKSVKGFDPDYKISHEEMNEMIAKSNESTFISEYATLAFCCG